MADAVGIEPVSSRKFPGKMLRPGRLWLLQSRVIPMICSKIPYAVEQGIFLSGTGKWNCRTGNCSRPISESGNSGIQTPGFMIEEFCALVLREHRGRISKLHHRKYPECAVLCGGLKGAPRYFEPDRQRTVRHTSRLANRQALSPRPYAHAGGDRRRGDRKLDDNGALSHLSAQEIW